MSRARLIFLVLLIAGGGLLFGQSKPLPTSALPSSVTNSPQLRAEAYAKAMQPEIDKRIAALNQLSEMPTNADSYDWELGQRTTWWGKPIDPKKFWAGRTIWLDSSVRLAANRLGRFYPPIPFDDPKYSNYSTNDVALGGDTVEGPNISYYSNRKEDIFWGHFQETHPMPPTDLEREQLQVANLVFENLKRETNSSISGEKRNLVTRALAEHYPPELFDDGTLFWTYVSDRQKVYRAAFSNGVTNSIGLGNLMRTLAVDPKYVTNSPSDQQVQAMNAWKISYLQRLRREKTDEQYIQAYLKAWNLTEKEVFGQGDLK